MPREVHLQIWIPGNLKKEGKKAHRLATNFKHMNLAQTVSCLLLIVNAAISQHPSVALDHSRIRETQSSQLKLRPTYVQKPNKKIFSIIYMHNFGLDQQGSIYVQA